MVKSFKDVLSRLGNKVADNVGGLLTKAFGSATYEFDSQPDNSQLLFPITQNPPSQQPVSTPTPAPAPMPIQDSGNVSEMIKMLSVYGGNSAPIHEYADQLDQARQKYDFWRNNPELLALIPHLETSSGRNVTRPNNLTNWGINYPGNNEIFAQMTPQEVLDRFITGVAKRSQYYKDFRTGEPLTDEELLRFASIYEPANQKYGPNLVEGRRHIRSQMGW
ncbi:MAG TPA: hypothetical protein PLT50_03725 [bacterium]|jgi:hypothetical protein|nr:hypothetical protein [bacterium]